MCAVHYVVLQGQKILQDAKSFEGKTIYASSIYKKGKKKFFIFTSLEL